MTVQLNGEPWENDSNYGFLRPVQPGKIIAVTEGVEPKNFQRQEVDPNGLNPKTPGAKLDAGKAPVVQGALNYFPKALTAVSLVSLAGAKKYHWKGWEKVDDGFNRYSNALGRHLLKESYEDYDDIDENGNEGTHLLHAAQVAWNALARLEILLRDKNVRSTEEK